MIQSQNTVIETKKIIREKMWNERNVKVYEKYRKLFTRKEQTIWRDILSTRKKVKVLDIGVGTGFLAEIALELGHECIGLDFSPHMLRITTKNLGQFKNFTPLLADAEQLPLINESIDVVICSYILWLLPDPLKMLGMAHRVLKPNGIFILHDGTTRRISFRPFQIFNKIKNYLLDRLICFRRVLRRTDFHLTASYLPKWNPVYVFTKMNQLGYKNVDLQRDLDSTHKDLTRKIVVNSNWMPFLITGIKACQ